MILKHLRRKERRYTFFGTQPAEPAAPSMRVQFFYEVLDGKGVQFEKVFPHKNSNTGLLWEPLAMS